MSIASWTSPPASAFTFPISRVIRSVSAASRARARARAAKRISPRFGAGTSRHSANASFAAATARSTSSAPGPREDADRLAGRGARALEGLAGGGVHPLAADEVLEALRLSSPWRRVYGAPLRRRVGVGERPRMRRRRRSRSGAPLLELGRRPSPLRRSGPSRRSTMTVTFGLSL